MNSNLKCNFFKVKVKHSFAILYGVDASEHIYAYDVGSIANLLPK
jgi:hypothetical protein